MKTAAIVLSGGSGKRMHADRPKQYLDLNGKPVICHALLAFEKSEVDEIVLVCGASDLDYCREEIVERYGMAKVKMIVPGGKERYHSVYNGLKAIEETGGCDYVLIHDGARPLVTGDVIARSLEDAIRFGASVAGVPSKDTVKISDAEGFVGSTPKRENVWQIQTPQTFSFSLICEANKKLMDNEEEWLKKGLVITDDAMIVETMTGRKVKITMGDEKNLKVTTPQDLIIAGYLAENSCL